MAMVNPRARFARPAQVLIPPTASRYQPRVGSSKAQLRALGESVLNDRRSMVDDLVEAGLTRDELRGTTLRQLHQLYESMTNP